MLSNSKTGDLVDHQADSKTCFILGGNFNLDLGTASTNLATEIAKGFEQNGMKTFLIPLNRQKSPKSQRNYWGIDALYHRIRFFDALPWPFSILRTWLVLLLLTIRCANRKKRPDVLFCMTMWFWASFWVRIIGSLFGIKTVYFLVEEPFALAKMKRDNGDQNFLQFRFHTLQAGLTYFSINSFDWLCCITNNLLEFAREKGADASNSSMFPNVRFQPPNEELNGSPPVNDSTDLEKTRFVYSGRINYTRDEFATLFEAIRILIDRRKQLNGRTKVEFHIYGSGPKNDIQKIKQQIQTLNLGDNVYFHGFVDRSELMLAQQNALAFLLLKADIPQNQFNFPTKLMDYLKHEKPIVMTKISTHRQYFNDRKDCVFVEPGVVDELVDAFEFLIDNQELGCKMGQVASRKLDNEFSAAKRTAELLTEIGFKPS